MVCFTPEEIARVVNGVLSGEFKSAYNAWKKTGISRQTIQARLNGCQTPKEVYAE
jgi:hypothetical protein